MENLPNIEPFRSRFNELEQQLSLPETFKDNQKASELSREHRRIKKILELSDHLESITDHIKQCKALLDDPEIMEEAESISKSISKHTEISDNLLLEMLPPDPEVGKNTIIEIRAGAGGVRHQFSPVIYSGCTTDMQKVKIGVSNA